jgi:hypothetical protein
MQKGVASMASGDRLHGAVEIHDAELDDDLGLALQDLDPELAQRRRVPFCL